MPKAFAAELVIVELAGVIGGSRQGIGQLVDLCGDQGCTDMRSDARGVVGGLRLLIFGIDIAPGEQAGICCGEVGTADGEFDIAGHDFDGLAVELGYHLIGLEIVYLGGELAGKASGVECRDRADAALARAEGLPGWLDAMAKGAKRSKAGDENGSCHIGDSLLT